jgi:hypothetical protein
MHIQVFLAFQKPSYSLITSETTTAKNLHKRHDKQNLVVAEIYLYYLQTKNLEGLAKRTFQTSVNWILQEQNGRGQGKGKMYRK